MPTSFRVAGTGISTGLATRSPLPFNANGNRSSFPLSRKRTWMSTRLSTRSPLPFNSSFPLIVKSNVNSLRGNNVADFPGVNANGLRATGPTRPLVRPLITVVVSVAFVAEGHGQEASKLDEAKASRCYCSCLIEEKINLRSETRRFVAEVCNDLVYASKLDF
jgi:hypothetical protein